jgi:hypothetical protein
MNDEIILRLPRNLTMSERKFIWRTVERNSDCLSYEKVLVIRNNGLGITVAERVARRLRRKLEDFWTRLVERPLMESDWREYHARALHTRILIKANMRDKLRSEPGIPGELAKKLHGITTVKR